MPKIKEKTIENKIAKFYKDKKNKVIKQVWMSQKRIDIVLKESETDHIIAIEVKIGDWKTALRQANLNKIACDKSYVAMWHKGSKGAIHNGESFKRLGVGLIVIDDAFVPKIEIPAADFNVFNPFAYNYVGAKL